MAFYTYILYSETIDRYYVGSCQDLDVRLTQHNTGRSKSTKAGSPWQLKYKDTFATRAEAQSRENEIKKKKSRKYIEWLISSAG
ncbi:GIY-YIG nuclease family protein [Pontibacter sp. KCTC 32443]|uniref:GIY-YIG nuclease family protein n=1 Tax=Pontibacter TaxID=323449 RepID=UPI00164EA2F4|nr:MULTISPECIES: GIY-YIG nuclease family protein [Pontibacter]MBC5775469.1 GIY-YIG nuclease family protein [Pontibacter sp. KCTC 32443]